MKYLLAVGVLMTGLTFLYGTTQVEAGQMVESPNVTIGGFIAYSYTFNDDLADRPAFFFTEDNPNERNFDLRGEIDIGIEWAWATARFDMNFPADGNEETALANDNRDIGIEQVRFDLMPPSGEALNLTITGGVFNSPIGLQHQDPDQKDSITDGLQFGLVPSNLFGINISVGNEYASLGAIVANEWHTDRDEELTFGFHTTLMPTDTFSWSLGGLFTTDAVGDNFVINTVASTTAFPWANIAVEGTVDEKNYGIGTTVRIARPDHPRCGATVRYEMIWADNGSAFTQGYFFDNPILFDLSSPFTDADHDFHLLSLTLFTEPMRHLVLQTEGRATMVEVDESGGDDQIYYGLTAQVVYEF